jgi:type I restriction enzyme S subunit
MRKNATINRNVPNLRFSGFHNFWKKNKLESLCSKIGSGKTPRGGENVYQKSGIPFIRSQNVVNDSLVLDDTYISNEIHLSMKGSKVLSNDILLNITGASLGRSCVVPKEFKEGNVNQHVSIIRVVKDNPHFLQSVLSSDIGQKLILKEQTGSGREGLNFESIKKFKIYLPEIEEQNKIASFLTLLNTRIDTQSKIIDNLESQKKGFAQQLFSRQFRFKKDNGNDYPKWEKKKLQEALSYIQPTKYLVTHTEYDDSYDTPVLTAGKSFLLGYTDDKEGIFKEKLPIIIFDDFTTAFKYVDFPFKAKSSAMKMLIKADSQVNIKFVYEVMKTIKFPLGEHKRYWISEYQHIRIPYPCEKEQTKIANFLSALDQKINIEKELLIKYKEQKAYFLQNLFI